MNKTQRVVFKRRNEVSIDLGNANSHSLSKIAYSSRLSRMSTALWVALAPVSLIGVSQAASAALVDNLANAANQREQIHASQVREALRVIAPLTSGSGNEAAGRLAANALSSSALTPYQLIVSGPIDGLIPTEASGSNAVAIGVNAHASGD